MNKQTVWQRATGKLKGELIMAEYKKIHAPGARRMSPQEFEEAKLISLLAIVAMLFKDAQELHPRVNGDDEAAAADAAQKLTAMLFGLLSACQRFFPSPAALESAVKRFSLSIGIQIDIEKIKPGADMPMAPSSKVPQ